MTRATPARMEEVKQMLLRHKWVFQGWKEGEVITRARRNAPDDGQHMEERRQPDRMRFRRGAQYASIGPGTANFWRWTKTDGSSDLVRIPTVQVDRIQRLLDERSPLSAEELDQRERERQMRVLTEQAKRAIVRR